MLDFMDYIQASFTSATRWDVDNSYASLTTTAAHLLDFYIPNGARLQVSSLSSPNFATSYTLGSKGVVDGSMSFLYSSLGLNIAGRTTDVRLRNLVRGYRYVAALRKADDGFFTSLQPGRAQRDTLLHGRLYLPASTLHAMYLRRLSPTRLLRITAVSDSSLPTGGTILAQLSNDQGKYSHEYLWSTDSSLLGVRGLYNFGFDPRNPDRPSNRPPQHPWDHQDGRLSLGAELFFSPLNKSGGLSTGLRFTTLPIHTGTPYTMTLTLNPLMGNLSSTYAVKAGRNLSLCSKFDFNVYSYESDVTVGLELWRQKKAENEAAWAKKMIRQGWESTLQPAITDATRFAALDDASSVVKARIGIDGQVGLLWEGKVKELLLSLGASVNLKHRDHLLGTFGCEISYSS
ncbi:hypothetical protein AMS68_000508 [Peltaster fructicola]|uniref:Mitochondrial distribution and morphology protein 10 n=1 Tax=Peltaster fructicola TaxID=286661 RepID=A0A6H0XK25_9PEZI|nr:hypothetical protein AMS68_000508 [Peltaster fructicola]